MNFEIISTSGLVLTIEGFFLGLEKQAKHFNRSRTMCKSFEPPLKQKLVSMIFEICNHSCTIIRTNVRENNSVCISWWAYDGPLKFSFLLFNATADFAKTMP